MDYLEYVNIELEKVLNDCDIDSLTALVALIASSKIQQKTSHEIINRILLISSLKIQSKIEEAKNCMTRINMLAGDKFTEDWMEKYFRPETEEPSRS